MFGSSKVSNVVENAMNNNVVNVNGRNVSVLALIVGIIIVLVLNLLVGPWLWNNIARRLVPSLGRARWYDTIALALLFGLIIPH
tara:strand:- start:952 stop:1203 length:252 start_codon:yes stop_codon:yes gene_type:complete